LFNALAVALAVALAGCSTASDHTAAIKKFADATASAKDAIQAYDSAATQRMTTIVRTAAVKQMKDGKGPGYFIDENDCGTRSDKCEAKYKKSKTDEGTPLTYKHIIPEHIKAAQAIADYAAALKEVTEADARPQVKAALDQASAATAALANVVQAGSGDAVKPFTGATANLLAWAYGEYQEQVKINALREATSKMNPHVRDAADEFAKVAKLADLAGRAAQAQAVEEAKAAVDASKSIYDMNTLATRVDQFDRELKTPPAGVFIDIADAHQKLTDALVKGPESLKDIYDAINRLAAKAEELQAIANAYKEAAEAAASK
jgi:hypothetical protein